MSLLRYTPTGANALQQQINQLFDQFDQDLFGRNEELGGGMFAPPMDVKEDAEAYTVSLEVPGVPRDKIDITLQDGALVIRGTREQNVEKTEGQYRRVERSYGNFSRSLSLPRAVDGTKVSADLTDGVLTVRLPKAEEAKPRQISIGATHNGNTNEQNGN
ncbi:MAG: Hsp20/alpha crystallin family protein [Armatimonadetes bacterium]|nr:Hsp20/alpha crystallin family protein [Armatimonadota bacterium]